MSGSGIGRLARAARNGHNIIRGYVRGEAVEASRREQYRGRSTITNAVAWAQQVADPSSPRSIEPATCDLMGRYAERIRVRDDRLQHSVRLGCDARDWYGPRRRKDPARTRYHR